jgi:flagellar biogenesis protein FliO
MELSQLLHTVLAFIFVLGLMFLTLWLIKICQQKGSLIKFGKYLNKTSRINILERHRLDIKNSVVLLKCDNTEYLILIGEKSHTLLQQTKVKD